MCSPTEGTEVTGSDMIFGDGLCRMQGSVHQRGVKGTVTDYCDHILLILYIYIYIYICTHIFMKRSCEGHRKFTLGAGGGGAGQGRIISIYSVPLLLNSITQ